MSDGMFETSGLIFIISHERAGTHLLQDILTTDSRLETFDEVCNFTSAPESTLKWHNFLERCLALDPEALQPSGEKRYELVKRYIALLDRSRTEGKRALVDIKYGHIHNFDDQWFGLEYLPLFLAILQEQKARIIHLYRADTIAAICSNLLAERTGVYHVSESAFTQEQIDPVPADVIFHAQMLSYQQWAYRHHLASMDHVELIYEEDLSTGSLSERGSAAIRDHLGVDLDIKPAARLQKVSPGLNTYVKNYDSLRVAMGEYGYRSIQAMKNGRPR